MRPIVFLLISLPERISRFFPWFGPLAARVALGLVFVFSGIIELTGTKDQIGALRDSGVPFSGMMSIVTAVATIVCGALLAAGLLTRLAAVLLGASLLVKVLTIDIPGIQQPIVWYQWLNSVLGFTRVEYIAILAWLAIAGPGLVSLDRARLGARLPDGKSRNSWLVAPPSDKIAWLGPLIARIVVGYVFMWAGWGKLTDLPDFIQKFTDWGIPYPQILTPFTSGVEFVGGILLMLGLLTRITGVALLIVSLVAILSAKVGDLDPSLGWHTWLAQFFNFDESLYMALCGWLAIAGAGAISIDRLLQNTTGEAPAEGEPTYRAT